MQIRILLLIKVCCESATLQGSILSPHIANVSVHGPSRLHSQTLRLLNFYFNADFVPASNSNARRRTLADADPQPWFIDEQNVNTTAIDAINIW
jgi:hypothetical protein